MLEARYANLTEVVSGFGQLDVPAEHLAKTSNVPDGGVKVYQYIRQRLNQRHRPRLHQAAAFSTPTRAARISA